MSESPAPHTSPAVRCFDRAIALLELPLPDRLGQGALVSAALAAVHHVDEEPSADPRLRLAARWLASRAFVKLGEGRLGREMAMACLDCASGLSPAFSGYAYEALHRSERLAGRPEAAATARRMAEDCAAAEPDRDAAAGLLAELFT
jgi:hypothetical protein